MGWRVIALMCAAALFSAGCDDAPEDGAGGAGGAVLADFGAGAGGGAGMAGAGGEAGAGGDVTDASVTDASPLAPQCSDSADNDDDGLIDLDDPGCDNALDDDERQLECADEIDNDNDGFIDFPDDPGCGSRNDNDEFNPPVLPECADGLDNDRNGFIDEQDPGCSAVADPDESPPDEVPACADRIDNDEDGITDFPLEPGCSAAGDTDEDDPLSPTGCANGQDDDMDGLTDYPDDPGCFGVGDRDEGDKPVTPDCADGQDNDRDGRTDYPNDDGCYAASDASERGSCLDDYDPPLMQDGVPVVIDTSRGIFNSAGSCGGMGSPESVVFYRLSRTVEALEVSTIGDATAVPTTLYVRAADCLVPEAEVACSTEQPNVAAPGQTLRIDNPIAGEYFIFVDGVAGAGGPVEVTVREVPLAECLNGVDDDDDGLADYPDDPGCDRPDDREELTEVFNACADDIDNDDDGQVDYPTDPGCISAAGDDETDRCGPGVRIQELFFGQTEVFGNTDPEEGQATNAINGRCGRAGAPEVVYYYRNPYNAAITINTAHPETEVGAAVYLRTTCDDRATELACDDGSAGGAGSGRVSVRALPRGEYYIVVDSRTPIGGAFKMTIESERDDPECDDLEDNDNDGAIDVDDPGCSRPGDDSERNVGGVPACNNGLDDDNDNRLDFPLDPGCEARGDNSEEDPADPPACLNEVDDDEDGIIDFPNDPGCSGRGDDTEDDPRILPACSNGIDDDGDDQTDFPDDFDCLFAGDPHEDR